MSVRMTMQQESHNNGSEGERAHRLLFVMNWAGRRDARALFEAIARKARVLLRVIAPDSCYCPYYNRINVAEPYCGPDYEICTGRIWKARTGNGGPYLSGLLRQILTFRPNIVHVFPEPYTMLHMQILIYRQLFLPRCRIYAQAADNIVGPVAPGSAMDRRRRYIQRHSDGIGCWATLTMNAQKAAGFPGEKIHLTHWGVPCELFYPNRNDDLRRRLGIDAAFVLGCVGKIEFQKGLWTVLLAMKDLPARFKFLCVGSGCWEGGFLRKVHDLGLQQKVIHVPDVPYEQVPSYMNAMDALVMPSETTLEVIEQFGRVLPEAMACGVPVIASDCGALPEVVGEAGMIFPERDYVRLRECVLQLASNPATFETLRARGLNRGRNYFSYDEFVSRLFKMYGI